MNKMLDVMEDIKQNITDNQYKRIMHSLMEINNDGSKLSFLTSNYKLNKIICSLNWLDTKLELTDTCRDTLKRNELYKFVVTEYFNDVYFQNKDLLNKL